MLLLLALWCDDMHRMWIWCLKMSNWGNAKAERYVHQFSPLLPWTLHRGSKDYKKICGPELEQREIKNFENVNPEVWQNNASVSIGCSCILYLANSTGIWYENRASMIQAGELMRRISWNFAGGEKKICILCKDGLFEGPTLQVL